MQDWGGPSTMSSLLLHPVQQARTCPPHQPPTAQHSLPARLQHQALLALTCRLTPLHMSCGRCSIEGGTAAAAAQGSALLLLLLLLALTVYHRSSSKQGRAHPGGGNSTCSTHSLGQSFQQRLLLLLLRSLTSAL